MQELKVIGVESGALVVMSDDGDRFRIEIDDVLQSRIKQHQHAKNASGPRVSPRMSPRLPALTSITWNASRALFSPSDST